MKRVVKKGSKIRGRFAGSIPAPVSLTCKIAYRPGAAPIADPELDPLISAQALSAMVGRMANSSYVLGDEVPFEQLVATLTRLWANALHLNTAVPVNAR